MSGSSSAAAHLVGPPLTHTLSQLPGTIPELIDRAATDFAAHGITVRDRTGRSGERRSYAEVAAGVRGTAAAWRANGLQPGECALIALPTSWDFILAWLGAIYLGARPAAIAPFTGEVAADSVAFHRLRQFRDVIDARRILASERVVQSLQQAHPDGLGRIAIAPDALRDSNAGAISRNRTVADDTAFLQFTSGSTGTPRAVIVRHSMAIHNALGLDEIVRGPNGEPGAAFLEACVAWLPLHHDMGLIGCLLYPLTTGFDLDLMNPQTFLGRPLRFLEALHGRRVVTSCPNFGYQYCADRLTPQEVEGIDLSRLEFALCGSEMIRPETVEAFCTLVAGTGFRPEYFRPCYGMAEATLAATFDGRSRGARTHTTPHFRDRGNCAPGSQAVVCVGTPLPETEVRIVAADEATASEDEIGEVWVKGPAVLAGYFRDAEATQQTLAAGWLKTGDLGFVHAGELYIAGRLKEILVIRGENVMPHEIEWLAEEARGPTASAERTAAFSVQYGERGEEVVLVVETSDTDPERLRGLEHAIRSRIGKGLSLPLADVVFVRRGQLPRTSSGKVRRGRLCEDYLRGALERMPPSAHAKLDPSPKTSFNPAFS